MHMVASKLWTADMVRELPDDGNRYETVDGVLLVNPPPRPLHASVNFRLVVAIGNYLEREPVGRGFSIVEISTDPHTLVEPDLAVADRDEARTLTWSRMKRYVLVVEIVSPASRKADRVTKRVVYQRAGVETYWVVDADAGAVEVWTPEARNAVIETTVLRWHPRGASTPLEIPLAELFAE